MVIAIAAFVCGLALLARALHFAYSTGRSRPAALPEACVVFALAFEAEDPSRSLPGPANQRLAVWLAEHVSGMSVILAQEAILWALAELGPDKGYEPHPRGDPSLAGHLAGVPVHRMHVHDARQYVPTLEALCCALTRLPAMPDAIVLVAHDKQYGRASRDLRARYRGLVVDPGITRVPYRTDSWWLPLQWAFRELYLAGPRDRVVRMLRRCQCPSGVTLPRLP